MSEQNNKKYIKVGTVMDTGKGPFIVLGNSKATNPKYKYDTAVRVTTGDGTTHTKKNAILTLKDPRKNNKFADKVPSMIQYEIILVEEGS